MPRKKRQVRVQGNNWESFVFYTMGKTYIYIWLCVQSPPKWISYRFYLNQFRFSSDSKEKSQGQEEMDLLVLVFFFVFILFLQCFFWS